MSSKFSLIVSANSNLSESLKQKLASMGYGCACLKATEDLEKLLPSLDERGDLELLLIHCDVVSDRCDQAMKVGRSFKKNSPVVMHVSTVHSPSHIKSLISLRSDYVVLYPMDQSALEVAVASAGVRRQERELAILLGQYK